MADNVELKGLDNLENALKSLEKKMRTKEVFTMISKGAEVVKAEIKKNAPVMRGGSKKNKTKTRSAGLVRRSVSIRRSSIDRRQKNIGVFVNVKPAKKENRGSVISMGAKCVNGVKVGDTVIFRGTGIDVSDEFGKDHIIISEDKDVLFYQTHGV